MFEINFHVNKCHLGFSCFPIIGVSMPAFFHVIPQNSKNENRMEKKHKSKLNIEHTHTQFFIESFSSIAFTQLVICSMVI